MLDNHRQSWYHRSPSSKSWIPSLKPNRSSFIIIKRRCSLKDILQRLTPYREEVESAMMRLLEPPSPAFDALYGMMHYHLGWADRDLQPARLPSGKRLRPLFCLLVCETVSGQRGVALPAAVAVELVHNFSLIHDDIEDQDTERHHRPTLWSRWGIAHGINTGDAMFVLARNALRPLLDRGDVPAHQAATMTRRFDETTLALCQGQYLDITFETIQTVDVESYLRMIRGKTAALLAFATETGARLGGAPPDLLELYRRFGESLGMAFQMIDDELGVWGDSQLTGKPVGVDLRQRKKSLPVVHAMANLPRPELDKLQRLYASDEPLVDADVFRVTRLLEQSGAREFVRRLAGEAQEEALAALEKADPAGPAGRLLRDLTNALLDRSF